MTMVVRRALRKKQAIGQSMVEFALLVPVLILFFQILIQAENAISTAIVNQRYAKATLHFLAFNHRNYMELKYVRSDEGKFMGRYWVGVDDKVNFEEPQNIQPSAPIRTIGRQPGSDDGASQAEYPEVQSRQKVRVRVTAFSCLPPHSIKPGFLLSEGNMEEDTFLAGRYPYCSP